MTEDAVGLMVYESCYRRKLPGVIGFLVFGASHFLISNLPDSGSPMLVSQVICLRMLLHPVSQYC